MKRIKDQSDGELREKRRTAQNTDSANINSASCFAKEGWGRRNS